MPPTFTGALAGEHYRSQGYVGVGAELFMGTTVIAATGVSAGVNDPQTDTYEVIPFVVRIDPPSGSTANEDFTHLRSPGEHSESRPGMRDSDEAEIELHHVPSHPSQSQTGGGTTGAFATGGLLGVYRRREVRNWIIRTPDGVETDLVFTAYISGYDIGELATQGGVPLTIRLKSIDDILQHMP